MEKTRIIVAIGGALLLLGGATQFFAVLKRRGRAPWRGAAVSAGALTLYGVLALTGLVVNGTVLGAVLVWAVAMGMWLGLWLSRREAR